MYILCLHIGGHVRLYPFELFEEDLNKRSAKQANKSTLVARGADTQLGSSCVSAPLATNVNLWNLIKSRSLERMHNCVVVSTD